MKWTFTRPQVAINVYEFLSSVVHKKLFEECLTKQLLVPIDFHSFGGKSMETRNCLVTSVFQNIFFLQEYILYRLVTDDNFQLLGEIFL